MKKLFTNLFIMTALIAASLQSQAQYCGSSQITLGGCGTPDAYVQNNAGFPPLDSIPCIQSGVANNIVIQFKNYTNFSVGSSHVHVYRMRIDSIENLPCGICWSTNKADNSFYGGDFGCFKFQGTTTDPAGQYKTRLWVSVNTQDTSANYIPSTNADAGGIELFVRVQNGGTCAAVDTSAGGQRLQATCETHVLGVNEVVKSLRDLNILPNPMSSEAHVTFTSENGGTQQVRITNLIGSEVYNTSLSSKVGMNDITISRNGLPAGIYILSVGNNQGSATRKFVITE